MFTKIDKNGKQLRYKKAVIDCSKDKILVEQSHKSEVDINNIVKRHGIDLIQKTNMLLAPSMQFDDVTGNDFQEASIIIAKAQQSFNEMPSALRQKFHNNPAEMLDFVQNPDNLPEMIELGMATARPPEPPIKVEVTNAETPPPGEQA